MQDKHSDHDDLPASRLKNSGSRRGRLKIFIGYAAGVGKTYAMLKAAHRQCAAGIDAVVGYFEPQSPRETSALLDGLEAIPTREVNYRGVTIHEFDLDAALARRPEVVMIDELAHTNAADARHAKRWQDVEELLAEGIDVYATLNVQHIESLNDVVAQITGVIVRETIPDAVLESVDYELVDVTPEELIERWKSARISPPAAAEVALKKFFQRGNLVALRELTLRQVAQQLNRDVVAARQRLSAQAPWATTERLLVCVGPSPSSAKLIRTAKRMATAFGAEWLAVSVEPCRSGAIAEVARQRVAQHLQLAERLGAETCTVIGDDVAQTILQLARSRNITKIVVGKTRQPRWKRLFLGTVVDALLEHSGDIDVYVIRHTPEDVLPQAAEARLLVRDLQRYFVATVVVALCGLLSWLSHTLHLTEANIVMVFLLGITYVAARCGRGPAIVTAVCSVVIFDFFFVQPYLRLAVNDAQYLFTFAAMLGISIVISTLTARIRDQLRAAKQMERHTSALFRLTKQLSVVAGAEFLTHIAGKELSEIFDGEAVVFLADKNGSVELRHGEDTTISQNEMNSTVAQWVADHQIAAGFGTDTLPSATALFVPLIGSQRVAGAVGVKPRDPKRFADPEQRRLLETCASLVALSLERDQSVLQAHEAQMQVQAEQLRSSLLSSISHDLRTPLAAIAGTSSSLLETGTHYDGKMRQEMLQSLVEESHRMARLVDNLLDMMRLDCGAVVLNKQWHVLEEIIGTALSRLRRDLQHNPVRVEVSADLPLVSVDGVLMEQMFVNLLENAARYTPRGSQIEIGASRENGSIEIRVADRGPGLPPGSEARVFEKFYRAAAKTADGRRGMGLGLAICQAVIQAHGGQITARNRPVEGAEFTIVLPCPELAPQVVLDEIPTQ